MNTSKINNNKRGVITLAAVALWGIVAGGGYWTYKNVNTLKANQQGMAMQVNQNTNDINQIGNYVAAKPWTPNYKAVQTQERQDWRSIIPNGSGGLQ